MSETHPTFVAIIPNIFFDLHPPLRGGILKAGGEEDAGMPCCDEAARHVVHAAVVTFHIDLERRGHVRPVRLNQLHAPPAAVGARRENNAGRRLSIRFSLRP